MNDLFLYIFKKRLVTPRKQRTRSVPIVLIVAPGAKLRVRKVKTSKSRLLYVARCEHSLLNVQVVTMRGILDRLRQVALIYFSMIGILPSTNIRHFSCTAPTAVSIRFIVWVAYLVKKYRYAWGLDYPMITIQVCNSATLQLLHLKFAKKMDFQRKNPEKPKLVKLERDRGLSNSFPDIDKLNIIGFHSMNTNYEFEDNLSQLRYLKLPTELNPNLDLKITADKIVKRKFTTNQKKIDHLLKWILAHQKEYDEIPSSRCIKEIVCYRSLLSKVMSSPLEKFDGWIVCATKFQGKIYLCDYDTPKKVMFEENCSESLRDFSDWGIVFDQCMTSVHPKHLPDKSLPADKNEEFHCVFRRKLGHHNILYGAEMDALKIDDKLISMEDPVSDPAKLKDLLEKGLAKFVEVKTSFDASTNRREWLKICSYKSLRWWIKCYMSGIQEVICGYRGIDGIVTSIQTFRVGNLPQLGRDYLFTDLIRKILKQPALLEPRCLP